MLLLHSMADVRSFEVHNTKGLEAPPYRSLQGPITARTGLQSARRTSTGLHMRIFPHPTTAPGLPPCRLLTATAIQFCAVLHEACFLHVLIVLFMSLSDRVCQSHGLGPNPLRRMPNPEEERRAENIKRDYIMCLASGVVMLCSSKIILVI